MQGFGFEEAHLPENGMLRPFRKKRVPVGNSQEACVLELVGVGPDLALEGSGWPGSSSLGSQLSHVPDPGP